MLYGRYVLRRQLQHPTDHSNRKLVREVDSIVERAVVPACDVRRVVEQERDGTFDKCSVLENCHLGEEWQKRLALSLMVGPFGDNHAVEERGE